MHINIMKKYKECGKCVSALKALLHKNYWDFFSLAGFTERFFTGQNDEWNF